MNQLVLRERRGYISLYPSILLDKGQRNMYKQGLITEM